MENAPSEPRPIDPGKGCPRVAFQGERGAFSDEAARQLFSDEIELVPRPTFEALFSALDEGAADYALAPMENSLAGSVHRCYDLLLERGLQIIGETILRISHCLIACPGATPNTIRSVESHPVALAQCERFFLSHPHLRRVAAEDTAGSVRRVVESRDSSRAAIASRFAAQTYGGVVLQERLEDHSQNYTRFVLLSGSPHMPDGADKISLVMKVAHRPGALYRALGPFVRRNLNLLKIESRPLAGRPWEYRFYLDFQASIRDTETRAALDELRGEASEVILLGCYPGARTPQSGMEER